MKIAVAGTGYVGLVTGACLAFKGHDVVCVDVDEKKVERLRSGDPVIYENGLEEVLQKCIKDGTLSFTTDYKSAYKDAEVVIISVGTPEKKDGSANLIYINGVADQIADSVERDCIIIMKSTVPIGTSDRIEARIISGLTHPVKVELASNPEFLAQGTAVENTLNPDRIIIGVKSTRAEKVLLKVYKNFDAPKLVVKRHSAEMIKYASNDFLALKISYVNEIANLCELTGADIDEVTCGMGFDPRIGSSFLRAGTGYGGSCFPKDTKALHWLSNIRGHELKTVRAAIDVNESQKLVLIKKAHSFYENFTDVNIAVLGLTFKPNTDDLRESPSLSCIPYLVDDGAKIKAWDPVGAENFKKFYPDEITYCDSISDTLEGADICFIFTEWPDVKEMDVSEFSKKMRKPLVLDGRNCFSLKEMKNKGVTYMSIGRPVIKA
jgi:UDPglucose 6-dehydrogenase